MNNVALIGRLVRDPELRSTPSGQDVCEFRIAVDRAGTKQDDGKYGAGFFDVTTWGKQAETCAQYLAKGRQVGVAGELRFHEWEAKDGGGKRSKVEINAFRVDFIGGRDTEDEGGQQRTTSQPAAASSASDFDSSDFGNTAAGSSGDDDIPF